MRIWAWKPTPDRISLPNTAGRPLGLTGRRAGAWLGEYPGEGEGKREGLAGLDTEDRGSLAPGHV